MSSLPKPTFRSLSEFFDVSSFSWPPSPTSEFVARINVNLTYYVWNYIALVALAFIYTAFHRWYFVVCLVLVLCCGVYIFRVRRTALVVAGRQFSRQEVFVLYVVVSLIIGIWSGGVAFIVSTIIALCTILLHACVRQRSVKARAVSVWSFLKRDLLSSKDEEGTEDDADADPEMGRGGGRGEDGGVGGSMGVGLNGNRGGRGGDGEQEILKREQAKFRSNFRASMRAKYLKE